MGIPRAFRDYADYVDAVDLLVRTQTIPESTFLWWDVRPQPRFGTVEMRIMDAQTTVEETAALCALVQSIARLELEEGWMAPALLDAPEALHENRFIAARDGVHAQLVDAALEQRVPLREWFEKLVPACRPHAEALGCERELDIVPGLVEENGALRQLSAARSGDRLPGLVAALAEAFCAGRGAVSVADST